MNIRDYELLYDLPQGEYDGRGIGGIRTRTTRAGDTLEVECYPMARVSREAQRELLRRRTTAAQDRLNRRNAQRRVCRLIEANFKEGSHVVHGTYDYGFIDAGHMDVKAELERWERAGVPWDDEDMRRDIRNYLARVKYHVRRAGGDPKEVRYLYVIESTKARGDGLPCRYHFHMVLHAPGLTREQLESLWPHGWCNCDRLSLRKNGAAALATYLTKQHGRHGDGRRALRWARSKNLKEPEVTVSDRGVSRRRAALVARDVMQHGRQIFEALYPGYRCEESEARFSDFMQGAFIYARLRRIQHSGRGG